MKTRSFIVLLALCLATVGSASSQVLESPGKNYALLFAGDTYEHWGDLVNPINDARTLGEELQQWYGYEVELVEDPTQEVMLTKIREYAERTYGENDHLLIFYAGHGKFDEVDGEGYIVSADSKLDDLTNQSYIPYSQLRTRINNIPSDHILLMLDACFGGTFDARSRGNDPYDDVTRAEFIARKLAFKTRRYITSGGKEYVPDGRPGHHSPFMRRLLEVLRTYGGEDQILTLGEIQPVLDYVDPLPIFGEFGDNQPGSDFLLVARSEAAQPVAPLADADIADAAPETTLNAPETTPRDDTAPTPASQPEEMSSPSATPPQTTADEPSVEASATGTTPATTGVEIVTEPEATTVEAPPAQTLSSASAPPQQTATEETQSAQTNPPPAQTPDTAAPTTPPQAQPETTAPVRAEPPASETTDAAEEAGINSTYVAATNTLVEHISTIMLTVKGDVPTDLRRTTQYLDALALEKRGRHLYEAGLYTQAAVLFDQAKVQFVEAASAPPPSQTVPAALQTTVDDLVATLETNLTSKDSGGMGAMFYQGRNWTSFFAGADSLDAAVQPGAAQVSESSATVVVQTVLSYRDATGERQQEILRHLWAIRDMGGTWMLTRVTPQP